LDAVFLSRLQFALTVGFHFIFPPLTIGMSWIIAYMMTKYARTGDEYYRSMSRFWIKLFGITFAVGVATGITMEFQFGTNWAGYSRFVGDIFGAPLAAEAVIAFFLESTFLAVLLLGWNKVSVKVHCLAAYLVAIGATISAFWIIVANSWQQTPAGYEIVNGRAELTSFAQAVFNPSTTPRFLHTVDGALVTGAMFMMGISALFLLRDRHARFALESLKIGLVVAAVASFLQFGLGHGHAIQVAKTQPAKLASMEALDVSTERAPAIVFAILDPATGKKMYSLEIPGALSWLVHQDVNKKVTGLDAFAKDELPPLELTFYSFHLMVILGFYFMGLTLLGLFFWWRKALAKNRFFLWLAVLSIPLPFVANELGWIAAEVGRQPWIVYKLLKTSDAISVTVPAAQILFTTIMFTLIYILLFAAWLIVLRRQLAHGPETVAETSTREAK